MEPKLEKLQHLTRRSFLESAGRFSLGAIALAGICGTEQGASAAAVVNPLAPKKSQFQPKVKRVSITNRSW